MSIFDYKTCPKCIVNKINKQEKLCELCRNNIRIEKEEGDLSDENLEVLKMLEDLDAYQGKVGEFVRRFYFKAISRHLISENDLNKLLSYNYCKDFFNINFPLLKKIENIEDKDRLRKDENGYPRYYTSILTAYSKSYLVSHELYNESFLKMKNWLVAKIK